MTDIEDDQAASTVLAPRPASQMTNYQDEIQFAQLMAKAKILPAHLHGNPGNCLAVITMAQSWNMNPIMVGLKTSVIPKKGGGETLMFEGQLVNAAINRSAYLQGRLKFELSGEGAETVCVVRGRLKGESEDRTVTVGMPATQNSPLWKGNQGDKEQQLTYLGARVWCRRHLPEILLGVYTPEDPWEERDDQHNERSQAVASRVAVLEAKAPAATGIPATVKDDFIDADTVAVRTTFSQRPIKAMTDNGVIDLPEAADPMDEPIPDFGATVCKECNGKGIIEDENGKGPCHCKTQKKGS